MLIRNAEVEGLRCDVRVEGAHVTAIEPSLERRKDEDFHDARGGVLLPGLHDHHIHLLATAALADSIGCGPLDTPTRGALAAMLRAVPGDSVRGVGYHESVAGLLDRDALDEIDPSRPIRIQHRSGALWMLNSRAVEELGLDRGADAAGVERDASGRATGRLHRLDAWLRERLPRRSAPNLWLVGRLLARLGVTGVTDATPDTDASALALFEEAVGARLPVRLCVMGRPDLPQPTHPEVSLAQVKLVLDEVALPGFDALAAAIAGAHARGRGVAIHCVGRAELVLAARALLEVGARPDDRLEHASIAPPDLVELVAASGVTVVTQPGFVFDRGYEYLRDVDPGDLPWLYRCRGWLDAGVRLAAGSDAPFGPSDPWIAMRAAVERLTRSGVPIGENERLAPEQALALFLAPLEDPGGRPRRVAVGVPADLCLLDCSWSEAREDLSNQHVRATWRAGRSSYLRGADD